MELAASQFAFARPRLAGLFQQVLTVGANFVNGFTHLKLSTCPLGDHPFASSRLMLYSPEY
jgi:hypothetical protein